MYSSEKQDYSDFLSPRGKNCQSIKTINTIKTIQTQLQCGFQDLTYWKTPLYINSVFQFSVFFTPRLKRSFSGDFLHEY